MQLGSSPVITTVLVLLCEDTVLQWFGFVLSEVQGIRRN